MNQTQHERTTTTVKLKQTNKTRKKAIKLCGMFEKNRWVFSLDLKRSPSIVSYNRGGPLSGRRTSRHFIITGAVAQRQTATHTFTPTDNGGVRN